jgi:dolichol-phosphate mannosyltransferase
LSSPADNAPLFSIVIPAHDEEGNIEATVGSILDEFRRQDISDFEVLIINDNSQDGTEAALGRLVKRDPRVWYLNNGPPNGFGFAVRYGLENFRGRSACVVMADLSDSPADIVTYYRAIAGGAECVFGSRFIKGAHVHDYPPVKLVLNRLANAFIRILLGLDHNDITNAFKAYRREVIEGIQPLLSHHFNLTVEMPLKAIVRGYHHVTVPISWTNRKVGISKLKIHEMGSRYLFIVLYVLLEKLLSCGDYRRRSGGRRP